MMRAIAISTDERRNFGGLLDDMHRLRARVFGSRLGWAVNVEDGREHDEYDAFGPTYILALTEQAEVAGCARLLPAIGPTMLDRTFPQLLAAGKLASGNSTIESSRFCVDTTIGDRGGRSLHQATLTMFAGIIEWSMANGYTQIATATDVRFERILQRAGWPMTRLGEPQLVGETMAVAGQLPVDSASFTRVRPQGYRSDMSRPRRFAA